MRIEKVTLGNYVTETFKEADYLYFIHYQGLNVQDVSEFRNRLAAAGSSCHVVKNTLIRLGLLNSGHALPEDLPLTGDTAVVFGSGDPCPAARIVKDFGKDHEQVSFKGGLVEGDFLSAADAVALAELPPKEVLQAILLGVLEAPKAKLVRTLHAKVASVVYVLAAYRDKLDNAS